MPTAPSSIRTPTSRAARARRVAHRTLRLAVSLAWLGACEHPIAIVTPHVEASDVVLRELQPDGARGPVVARTFDNRRWEGSALAVTDRAQRRLVVELLDFRQQPIAGLDGRDDVELRVEAEKPGVVAWEPRRGHGVLHALAPGATRVRVLVWHGTHADLVTPWLEARVVTTAPTGALAGAGVGATISGAPAGAVPTLSLR